MTLEVSAPTYVIVSVAPRGFTGADIAPGDPGVFAAAVATLAVAATLATLVPAPRAARIDPTRTLRAD